MQNNQYIVVTLPDFFEGEAERITGMFQAGLERLHLRKPACDIGQMRRLLQLIPACYHERIVLHEHFSLAQEFCIGGVHLNRRHPEPPLSALNAQLTVSRSCHSLQELEQYKGQYAYLSLSPIFNSISKEGYKAAFSREELLQAKAQGLINERVMALGGVCRDTIDQLPTFGFGGGMVLGDAWPHSRSHSASAGNPPVVLSIAGSDPSAGAGIQQDLKTITQHACYATTVITSLTTQNTLGVQATMPVPAEVVKSQLQAVLADMRVCAIKIGIIANMEQAKVIVALLKDEKRKHIVPVIYDPVMLSTSGHPLMSDDCIEYVQQELFPLCTLLTPNLPEAARLQLIEPTTPVTFSREALAKTSANILLKGGHAEGEQMTDVLYLCHEQRELAFSSPRVASTNLHGTGCTLSSAIASNMALGHDLSTAVRLAKKYVTEAIEGGKNLHLGHGNGPLWKK